jgi:hypothetical protein
VSLSDFGQRSHVARASPQVDANDARGFGRDEFLNPVGVYVMGARVNVAEDRGYLLPLERMCRGDKGESWNDDLAAQTGGADRDLQTHSGIAHGNAVFDPEHVGNSLFEFLYKWPSVREPTPAEHLRYADKEAFPVAEVRTANVQRFRKGARTGLSNGSSGLNLPGLIIELCCIHTLWYRLSYWARLLFKRLSG